MSRFRNKVRQAGQNHQKGESSPRIDLYKFDKRHKLDKRQPLQRGPRYERYTPLTTNRANILKPSFSAEVPIQLPPRTSPRPGMDITKHCRYHRNHGHNTIDCWSLKDKIKELIQAGYLAQLLKKPNNNKTGGLPGGSGKNDDHHKRRDNEQDRRGDKT